MVTAKMAQGIADRLERAIGDQRLRALQAVARCDGYAVVRNGDGSQMYLVRIDCGHEN